MPTFAPITVRGMTATPAPFRMFAVPAVSLSFSASASTSFVPVFDVEPFGRRPIGVAQQPGQGGWDFPLVDASEDVEQLIADAWLAYVDDTNTFTLPFRINWLYGLGQAPVTVPITPVHTHDAEIVDALGAVVFSSADAGITFDSWVWDDRLLILEWRDGDNILRIVYHTAWSREDTPRTYDIYIEPASAVLDARVVWQYPRRLTGMQVGIPTFSQGEIEFQNGYNTDIIVGDPNLVDGQRRETVVTFNAVAGGGSVGKFGPGCDDSVGPAVRLINDVGPSSRGNFTLDAGGCYRIQRPVNAILTPGDIRDIQVRNHTLQISNDCGPCCECDDFINVWEAIRKLRNRYAALVTDAQAMRDLYHANRARWIQSLECRLNDTLRVVVSPICPGELGVAVGYCNNSDECLQNLVIHMSFQYADMTASPCTRTAVLGDQGASGGDPISAVTTLPLTEIVCQSVFRGGNIDPDTAKGTGGGSSSAAREFYAMGGKYPHLWTQWDGVEPGGMASITFRLRFDEDSITPSDRVELVADAYTLGTAGGVVVGGSPVPGYVPGEGPISTDPALHLVNCPKFVSTGLPSDPCCASSLSGAN